MTPDWLATEEPGTDQPEVLEASDNTTIFYKLLVTVGFVGAVSNLFVIVVICRVIIVAIFYSSTLSCSSNIEYKTIPYDFITLLSCCIQSR